MKDSKLFVCVEWTLFYYLGAPSPPAASIANRSKMNVSTPYQVRYQVPYLVYIWRYRTRTGSSVSAHIMSAWWCVRIPGTVPGTVLYCLCVVHASQFRREHPQEELRSSESNSDLNHVWPPPVRQTTGTVDYCTGTTRPMSIVQKKILEYYYYTQ